jgi:hypothetical protein
MTEAEWWACSEPIALLTSLRNRASRRRLRLFAVACCRRIWSLLVDERSRQAVDVAERFAEGRASRAERVAARTAALAAVATSWQGAPVGDPAAWRSWRYETSGRATAASAAQWSAARNAYDAASTCAEKAQYATAAVAVATQETKLEETPLDFWVRTQREEKTRQVAILHDLFGNPPRPIEVDATWLTPDVISHAEAIHTEGDFERMPTLGDALQRAGCEEVNILNHCHESIGHVRGCWVIDSLLGKT